MRALEDSDEHRLIADLTTLIFVDTYAMVALLTIMTLWRRDGDPVDLLLPEKVGVRSYLARRTRALSGVTIGRKSMAEGC